MLKFVLMASVLAFASPAESQQANDPVGYWILDTTVDGQPGQMVLKITRDKAALAVDVTTLMGSVVKATAVDKKGEYYVITVPVHDEVVLTVSVAVTGEAMKGKWAGFGSEGKLEGKRGKDPASPAKK